METIIAHHVEHGGFDADEVQQIIEEWLDLGLIDEAKLHLLMNLCADCGDYIDLYRMRAALQRREQPRFCSSPCRARMHARERRDRIRDSRRPTYKHVRPAVTAVGEGAPEPQPARRIGDPILPNTADWIFA